MAYGFFGYENFSHILYVIPLLIVLIFVYAFCMFFFIGVHQFTNNILTNLNTKKNLGSLFAENCPDDLTEYIKKTNRFEYQAKYIKRQVVPWVILTLTLGCIAFLLGAAHHTGVVGKTVHSGVVWGLWFL